jgi:tripartite-type tricarboxylate transporter receptor subunit TctC
MGKWCGIAPVIIVAALSASATWAQGYPNRPIRLVIPAPPGGGHDVLARLISQPLAQALGQQVVVDNRAGGNGVVGTQIVARSAPDGHTILSAATTFVTVPLLTANAPYSPLTDFAPIISAMYGPNILVVRPGLPAKSVSDLIALAKSQPGKLNYATGSSGGSPHLAAELFKYMAKADIVHVAYRGASQALIDLIAGQVDLMFATAVSVAPHVRSGKLRALAITSAQPSALAPELPTIAASGLPGYESGVSYGFLATARTPQPIVRRLNEEMLKVLQRNEVRERLLGDGFEVSGGTPDEYAAMIRRESDKWGKLIREVNIRVEGR